MPILSFPAPPPLSAPNIFSRLIRRFCNRSLGRGHADSRVSPLFSVYSVSLWFHSAVPFSSPPRADFADAGVTGYGTDLLGSRRFFPLPAFGGEAIIGTMDSRSTISVYADISMFGRGGPA